MPPREGGVSGNAHPPSGAALTWYRGDVRNAEAEISVGRHFLCLCGRSGGLVFAKATESKEGGAASWRRDNEFDSQVLFGVFDSCSALSGAGKYGQRFSYPYTQSIIHTDTGRKEFGTCLEPFRRRLTDDPDAFPPESWQLSFSLSLTTTLEENYRPACVGMTWRRLVAAGALRQ